MFKRFISWCKPVVRNYYLMTGLFFVIWMIFFDSNNVITQYHNKQELKELKKQKDFYSSEIEKNRKTVYDLTNLEDLDPIEKYAREKFYMKKPNEEIFLIIKESEEKN